MDGPLVSVIIPVKNGERFLASALESVFVQDYQPLEIIVVDDHSVDETARITKSYSQVCYVRNTGQGLWDGYNVGIDASRGEFIAFFSHDDLWSPYKLSTQVGYLLRHQQYQYAISRVQFFLEEGCLMPHNFKQERLEGDYAFRTTDSLVVKRSMLDTVGKFNPDYPLGSNIDWFAKAQHLPMAVIQEVLLYKRIHDANYSLYQVKLNSNPILKILKHAIDRKRKLAQGRNV